MHNFCVSPETGAHQGFLQTWPKSEERFYWPHHVDEIRKYTDSYKNSLSYKKKLGNLMIFYVSA